MTGHAHTSREELIIRLRLDAIREASHNGRVLTHADTLTEAADALEDLRELTDFANQWMAGFDGSGIEWHESLPNPYTYEPSDFSALVRAVHEYEARSLALSADLAAAREALQAIAEITPSHRDEVCRQQLVNARWAARQGLAAGGGDEPA